MRRNDIKRIANNMWGRYKIKSTSFKYNRLNENVEKTGSGGGLTCSYKNGKITVNGTSTATSGYINLYINTTIDFVNGHKYLLLPKKISSSGTTDFSSILYYGGGNTMVANVDSPSIFTSTSSGTGYLYVRPQYTFNGSIEIELLVVDITDWDITTIADFYNTDLGKEIQKGWYPPYSPTNTIYEADLSEATFVGELPIEYQRVEYIESTGTEYINTNYVPNNTSGFYIDTQKIVNNYADAMIIGTRTGTNRCWVDIDHSGENFDGALLPSWNDYPPIGSRMNVGLNRFKLYFNFNNDRKCLLNNEDYLAVNNLLEQPLDVQTQTLYIFGANDNGVFKFGANFKLYTIKITEGTTIVRNFIPCYRKADNVIGMYDTVNGVFYTNQGTGTFLKGNDVIGDTQTVSILQNGEPLKIGGYNDVEDYYLNASGKVNRELGNVDLGSLSWNYQSTYKVFFANLSSKKIGLVNVRCANYKTRNNTGGNWDLNNGEIGGALNGTSIYIHDENYNNSQEFKTAMNGITAYFEKATPTTEQANSVMLRKGFTKCYDKNNLELEIEDLDAVLYNQFIPNNLINLSSNTSTSPSTNLVGSYISILNPIPVGHKVYAKITPSDAGVRLVWYKNGTSGYDFVTGQLVNTNSEPVTATEGIYEITSDMIYTDGYMQLYYFVNKNCPTGTHTIKVQLIDLTNLGMENIINPVIFKATKLGKLLDKGVTLNFTNRENVRYGS